MIDPGYGDPCDVSGSHCNSNLFGRGVAINDKLNLLQESQKDGEYANSVSDLQAQSRETCSKRLLLIFEVQFIVPPTMRLECRPTRTCMAHV